MVIFLMLQVQLLVLFVQLEHMNILKNNVFLVQKDIILIKQGQRNALNVLMVIFLILQGQLLVLFVQLEHMNIQKNNVFLVQ